MLAIFLKTLPFFALIGLGWFAARSRIFPPEGAAWLTRFVFYFALSAMLFRFAATLDINEIWDPAFAAAYLTGSLILWAIGMAIGRARNLGLAEAAMEAHCYVIGNTGFLGVPMLIVLLGEAAAGPVLLILIIDLVVFSTLITVIVTGTRQGRIRLATLWVLLRGLLANPMIVSMLAGLGWSALSLPLPGPAMEFLTLLSAAATPGALFAIGASLVGRRAERPVIALWLSFAKLVLHPAAVAAACYVFGVAPFAAGVMIAAAALPVAGNVFMLAEYFGIAVQRVSSAILISTAASVATIPVVIHLIGG
ncbi:MAG TPA: AEC family transporter [Paracoccus sp. (in: a-proteobacteria)]|uniref:AEC family transporter n=1 Tax=uncultured Paracoccus sp. TaxID=189685 RepID=UPI002637DF6E|nr:AEC family transporter [uncultured Paracoccus sp.]HMQ40047.1 AEC family transporter [Paracoccus sp. (in: a-proteobacteria)]HMR35295.1 AEC family transporter [Paracoccus sp. (in: a-proteobacteria)]